MVDDNKDFLNPENTGNNKPSSQSTGKEEEKIAKDKKDKIIDKLISRIERLEKTADKKRMDAYDRLNQEDPETIYKLRVIDGKVVVGWSDLHKNKAEVNPITRKIEEDQPLTVYYEDKTSEDMQLVVFNRRYEYIFATLIEETVLKDPGKKKKHGNRIFKVKTEDGKEYNIGEKFIN